MLSLCWPRSVNRNAKYCEESDGALGCMMKSAYQARGPACCVSSPSLGGRGPFHIQGPFEPPWRLNCISVAGKQEGICLPLHYCTCLSPTRPPSILQFFSHPSPPSPEAPRYSLVTTHQSFNIHPIELLPSSITMPLHPPPTSLALLAKLGLPFALRIRQLQRIVRRWLRSRR